MKMLSRVNLTIGAVLASAVLIGFFWPDRLPSSDPYPNPYDTLGSTIAVDTGGDRLVVVSGDRVEMLPLPASDDTLGEVGDSSRGASAVDASGRPYDAGPVAGSGLLIPVAGIRAAELQDTYSAARSEDRVHNAIDIIAPQGAPVLAATDGRILKLFESERGGITIYQIGADGRTIYYYAHLDRYAEGLSEGQSVRRGELIAYVGNTGNAGPENYHLHFAMWIPSDPEHFWDGESINPYPLLAGR